MFIIITLTIGSIQMRPMPFGRSKKWLTTAPTPTASTILTPANNAPWFAGYSHTTCVGVAQGLGSVLVNTNNWTTSILSMSGDSGTATCMQVFTGVGQVHFFQAVINYIANVYEFDFQWHCLNFEGFKHYVDPAKKDNTNGFSCHCSGSMFDPQFTPCFTDKLYNPENMTFVDYMPSGYNVTLEMCHNLNTRGPQSGCILDFGSDTDYYAKTATVWKNYPLFKLKPRSIQEVVLDIYWDNQLIQNISLSGLDPISITLPIGEVVFNLENLRVPESVVTDYIVFSTDGTFNNLENIYMTHSDNVNTFGSFNPLKLCPIKQSQGTALEYRKWEIDKMLSSDLTVGYCYPAAGAFQSPFADLKLLQNQANLLTSRINPQTLSVYPGDTTVVKEKVEGALVFSIDLPPGSVIADTSVVSSTINDFKFTCLPSLNQDGFHCTVKIDVAGACQVSILATDSNNVIATLNVQPGTSNYQIIINPIYTSKDKVTLCAYSTWTAQKTCMTSALNYTREAVVDSVDSVPETAENGNAESKGIFLKGNKKFKAWFIGIFTTLGGIVILGLVWFFFPFIVAGLKMIKSWLNSCASYLKEKRSIHLSNPVEEEDEEILLDEDPIKKNWANKLNKNKNKPKSKSNQMIPNY